MKPIVLSIIVFLSLTAIAQADTIAVSRFAVEGLSGWEKESFKGETQYSIVLEGGQAVVKAHSRAAASGMFKKVQIDPLKYRYLSWRWKIAGALENRAEKTKAGDDYSARVYVIFPGTFFWQTKAINYVWSGRLPKGETFPNPFTRNAMMVVVESGAEQAGTWLTEQRDSVQEHGEWSVLRPDRRDASGVFTETHNSGV